MDGRPDDLNASVRPGKTTIHLSYELRKWYKLYATEHDTTMGSVIESVLLTFAREHGYQPRPEGQARPEGQGDARE